MARNATRLVASQQARARRILDKVRRLSVLDPLELKTPKQLIAAVQREAERLNKTGVVRDDELKDLKALHAAQLKQIAAAELKARKEAAERMKL